MIERKHIFIAIVILVSSVHCRNFIECDPVKASSEKSNECPENSQCVEVGGTNSSVSSIGGLCACKTNYTVNKSFSATDNSSLYCMKSNKTAENSTEPPQNIPTKSTTKSETLSTTLVPQVTTTKKAEQQSTTTNSAPPNDSSNENTNKKPTVEKQKQERLVEKQAQHILGGIILPVMIVLAFIAVVYGMRKYDLLKRAQNYISNRGQNVQTRYNGLENDFDDDPLLI